MRRFKSPGQVQRFLAVHSQVHNLFRIGRHLLGAANYRLLRNRSFETWQQVTWPAEQKSVYRRAHNLPTLVNLTEPSLI